MSNGLEVKAINPRKGDQYSPNLYKWLTDPKRPYRISESRVYSDASGLRWIGRIDDGDFIGERLLAVLCSGRQAESKCWLGLGKLTEVECFWACYMERGRCAIDDGHEMNFIGDEGRWQADGEHRTCQWCGQRQALAKWVEPVSREQWQNV